MSLLIEVQTARTGSAFGPAAEVGVLRMVGADRQSFLHAYTTGEIQKLTPDTGCTTAISSWKGTVIDFGRVLVRPDDLLLVGTPERTATVKRALEKFLIMVDVKIADDSAAWVWIEVVGPAALALVPAVRDLPLHGHAPAHVAGSVTAAVAIRTWGLRGDGLGLLVPVTETAAWTAWLCDHGATPISAEAREFLRIDAGIPRFGQDMDEETNVWEARLDASVSMDKGCYLGQEVVARLFNYHKVQRYLMGIRPTDLEPLPAIGTEVRTDSKTVGKLTSVATTPDGRWIGLAMVGREFAQAGQDTQVGGQGAVLEDRPFWNPAAVRVP